MDDALIMAGTAIVGGLTLNLQKRLSIQQQIISGTILLILGWVVALAMTASGPFPSPIGAAVGTGLLLTGVLLLLPALSRAQRDRQHHSRR